MFDLNEVRDETLSRKAMLRRVILIYCGDLDVNFVVTVFDPNMAPGCSSSLNSCSLVPVTSPFDKDKCITQELGTNKSD